MSSDHLSQHSQVSHQNLKIFETAMLAILTGFIILYNLQRINSQSRSADLYIISTLSLESSGLIELEEGRVTINDAIEETD